MNTHRLLEGTARPADPPRALRPGPRPILEHRPGARLPDRAAPLRPRPRREGRPGPGGRAGRGAFAAAAVLVLVLVVPAGTRAGDLPLDHATVRALADEMAGLEATIRIQAPRILETGPQVRTILENLEARGITAGEARAAHAGELERIPVDLRGVLEAAAPVIARHHEALDTYFETYDRWAAVRMDHRVLEAYLDLKLVHRSLEARAGSWKTRALRRILEAYREHMAEYMRFREVSSGRNAHKRLWAMRDLSQDARRAQLEIQALRARLGDVPGTPVGDRLAGTWRRMVRTWQNLQTRLALAPPIVRMLGYLGNPWKRVDPDRISSLLKEMGTRFTDRGGIQLEVTGRERIPRGRKVIFAPSHRSDYVDSMAMVRILPGRVTPLQTVFFYPEWIRPLIVRLLENEPGLILAQVPGVDVIQRCAEAVRAGRTLLFFPEGNIPSPMGEIRRLRSGLERITDRLLDEDVLVMPVTLDDPAESWGVPEYGTADRDLGMDLAVHYDRPLDPRVIHALSGPHQRLILNLIRERWHLKLIPELRHGDPDAKGSVESFSAGWDGPRTGTFETLHAPAAP